jgi:hypothetical protein
MPEIKNTFTQGKMNKDLDERLVPSGQYRDAMNIEVSTSDEAGVGTVQNLRGNEKVEAYIYTDPLSGIVENVSSYHPSGLALVNDQLFPELGICVGSVKDDKTDSLYWYIHNPWVNFKYEDGNLITPSIGKPYKDMILQYKQDIITPVFVDLWGIVHEPDLFSGPSNTVSLTSAEHVSVGMVASGVAVDATNQEIINSYTGLTVKSVTGNDVEFDRTVDVAATFTTYFIFTKPKVLNFKKKIITGLSIIDDMLFWTDNSSEPKKINIPRSIEGTDSIGNTHTNLINTSQDIVTPIKEEHITVIRKAPKHPPVLELDDGRRSGTIHGTASFDFGGTSVDDDIVLDLYPPSGYASGNAPIFNLDIGDELIMAGHQNFTAVIPLSSYDVRVVITSIIQNAGGNFNFAQFGCKILESKPTTPIGGTCSIGNHTDEASCIAAGGVWTNQTFTVDLFDETSADSSRLFEFKFPRFAYRYKYEDGEYSTISPYSEIAFLPGPFDYHPRKGFNIGMKNRLSTINVKEFVTEDIPKDVVEIDILYKESVSPNIYVVDTIKPKDAAYLQDDLGNTTNEWNYVNTDENNNNIFRNGKYEIKSETIYAALPSNQSLRLWDNVPRFALAQEISANRIIYGNYLQNFDMKDSGGKPYKASFNIATRGYNDEALIANVPVKSLKSIREYQLGVVYSDKYGRETPVLTNNTGVLRLQKSKAATANQLDVRLTGSPPEFAHSFKFYIKETSNEYYNLAMDRWYDAEDGNVWLSFPSSDRNKLDIDTFLILKKGAESQELVEDQARYKVLAIENEAPEFIKLKTLGLGFERHKNLSTGLASGTAAGATGTADEDIFGQDSDNFPLQSRNFFRLIYQPFQGSSLDNVHELLDTESFLFVRFSKLGTEEVSKDYRITNISTDPTNPAPGTVPTSVYFQIEDQFESDVNFIYDSGSNFMREGTEVRFLRKKPENSPRFDGRFFVKIYNDEALKDAIGQPINEDTNYRVVASQDMYWMSPDFLTKHENVGTVYSDYTQYGGGNGSTDDLEHSLNAHNWDRYMAFLSQNDFDNDYHTQDPLSNRVDSNPGVGEYQDVFFIDGMDRAGVIPDAPQYTNLQGGPNGSNSLNIPSVNDDRTLSPHQTIGSGGIRNYSNSCIIDISFGACRAEPDPNNLFNLMEKHFDIIDNGSGVNSNYIDANKMAKHFEPGKKIRWKEDPNGNIYTIVSAENRHCARFCAGDNTENSFGATDSRSHKNIIGYNWNKTRLFRLQLDKKMTWNPIDAATLGGLPAMNGYSPNTDVYATTTGSSGIDWGTEEAIGYTLEVVEPIFDDDVLPEEPAVWETEPKEDIDVDIYHEASGNFPINVDEENIHNIVRVGSEVTIPNWLVSVTTQASGNFIPNLDTVAGINATVKQVDVVDGNFVVTLEGANVTGNLKLFSSNPDRNNKPDIVEFKKDDYGISFSIKQDTAGVNLMLISPYVHNNPVRLDWHNCYMFANGVESNRIKDHFNDPIIDKGPKVSTTLAEPYKEERRKYGLIYSGIYNSISGVNNLNQFIQAEKITKEINPIYGSIQKLHSKSTADGDLVTLCEDRILKVLANKDALFNADGSLQLTATENVLGQAIPYGGEYGISTNPESFAAESYRAYFTDKSRGAVMRLSRDGLTPISDAGMTDWFRDNLVLYNQFMGSYDERKGDYNLTMNNVDLVDEVDPNQDTPQAAPQWNPTTTPQQPTSPVGVPGTYQGGGSAPGPGTPGY